MKIEALERSYHITNLTSQFICNGIYNNALNFLNTSQQLITLHRHGKGLSPMGWVLTDNDFDLIAQSIQPNSMISSKQDELLISPSIKVISQNSTNLSTPYIPISQLRILENLLRVLPQSALTGLYGALSNYQQIIQMDDNHKLINDFSLWLNGEQINWEKYIGKGPGLTPSSDDMLTGMLFTAHACYKEKVQSLSPFFKHTPDLSLLTTSVSKNYLSYAAQGIFSSYLITLANQLINNDLSVHKLFELLTVGHHSGADTLLGIGLGYKAIRKSYY